ncbi:hypothetical protein GCM10023085_38360 [Actinomadura viridis]|uniref:Raffinose/stachyose/melibiose transport system substrate-binding protein n=1 Tax=Actinomadura viridis TaxID=58110 RepID=A0A931DMV6_9ACTN|nr:ABC transporter substrate-binding protein [Actinomadura viridis]MBG6092875.1 raffinose/stachyose/melibiose transport system substrate-binding protein [Actinomadura viridis]
MNGLRGPLVPLALCASLLVAAGCGGGEGDGGELVVTTWDAGQGADPVETAARDFEKATPGVRVTVSKTAYVQYTQALRRRLTAGRVPDVATALLGYGEASAARALADKGLLTDLGGAPWAKRIPPASRFMTDDGGRTIAFPTESTAIGVFHDPRVLAKQGVTAPKTFADVLALCGKAKADGRTAFALGGTETSGMPRFVGFALAASSAFADDPRAGERRLAAGATFAGTAGWRRALEKFVRMRDAGCFPKDAAGASQEAASRALAQGKAWMAVAPTATLPLFQAGNPDARLEMFAFPGDDDPARVRVPAGPVSGLVVPAKARNAELAKRFLDFYAGNQAKYAGAGTMPGLAPSAGDPGLPAYAEALAPYLTGGRTAPIADQQWPNPEVVIRFGGGLVQILSGNKGPADVLTSMDSAWTAKAP